MNIVPDNVDEAREWIIRERLRRGWSTTALAGFARDIARREGSSLALKQQSISAFEQPGSKRIPEWMRYVRLAFDEWDIAAENVDNLDDCRLIRSWEPRNSTPTKPENHDGVVFVNQLDIRFPDKSGYPVSAFVPFNRQFLEGLAHNSTDKLFLVREFGNSMQPTLQKDDLILVDGGDVSMAVADLIWAIEYAGSGCIKRLRNVVRDGKSKIVILSDNADVPMEEADPQDVTIVGRVVWIGRKI